MATGGPDGPQNTGGGWLDLGGLTSAVTSTFTGWFGGKTAEATEGESYMASVGLKPHTPIDTRSITDASDLSYGELKERLIAELQAIKTEGSDDPDKFDHIKRAAIDVCIACLERDSITELVRHIRNYGAIFSGFPIEELIDIGRDTLNVDAPAEGDPVLEEEWQEFPSFAQIRNLKELKEEFKNLYRDSMKDEVKSVDGEGKKHVDNRPNTKVTTTQMALSYLNNGDLDSFIDLYQTSHWFFSTMPLSFLEAIERTSSSNTTLDQFIKRARKPLRKDYLYQAKRLPLGCAAMMQQDEATLMGIRSSCIQELESARKHKSASRESSAQRALDALKNGHWHDLAYAIRENAALKKEWNETAEVLPKQENLGYLAMIAKARILETYRKCLAEGTDQYFLFESRPDICDSDHWTYMLEKGEYDIEDAVAIDLKESRKNILPGGKRQTQREKLEEALDKYMPQLDDHHPLEVRTRSALFYDPTEDKEA